MKAQSLYAMPPCVPWIADVDNGQFYPDEFPVDRMSPGEVTHWMRFPE